MPRNYLVYLSGPIAGLTFEEAESWRSYVRRVGPENCTYLDPLRAKEFLKGTGPLTRETQKPFSVHPLVSDRGITARDHWDTQRADILLVNLLPAQAGKLSIGTVMEVAWAHAYKKPVICAIDLEGELAKHPIFREACDFVVPTLNQAVEILDALVNHA
jgi:hypothetical protein